MSRSRQSLGAFALAFSAGAAACASSDPVVEVAPPTPNVVTVVANDFSYEAPAEIPEGVTTFRLVAQGPTFHHAVIFRLDSAKTYDDLVAAFAQPGPPPAWAVPVGGPNAPAPGGGISNATIDLEPGNYAIICLVDVPDGVPHIAHGMSRPLTVTPVAADAPRAALPTPDVTIRLFDYNFELSAPIAAGTRMFEVVGNPGQMHEVELIRLEPGKTAMDMIHWVEKPEGPPPGMPVGGTAPAMPGMSVFFEAEMTPGSYAFICFVPDAGDGKPHFLHGMIKEFVVQ